MDRRMTAFVARRVRRPRALVPAIVAVAAVTATGAAAQTLTDPYPESRPFAAAPKAKPKPVVRTKSCSTFGAGFVNIPGTDACVKIGGWVTIEGSAGR